MPSNSKIINIKKVLFIVDKIEIGGVTTSIANSVKFLENKGIKTVIFGSTGESFDEASRYFPKTTKIISYEKRSGKTLKQELSIIIRTFRLIKDVVETEKPTIIHLSTPLSTFSYYLRGLYREYPSIIQFFGAWNLEVQSRINYFQRLEKNQSPNHLKELNFSIKYILRHIIQQYPLKKASFILSLSEYSSSLLTAHFNVSKNKILLLPGTIDKEVLKENNQKQNIFINQNSAPVLSIISRPDPRKGIHLAIKAAKILSEKDIKYQLIIGLPDFEGDYFLSLLHLTRQIKEEIKNFRTLINFSSSVHFVKTNSIEAKRDLMNVSDIFIMSSTELETFGITTIEALSMGTIVVSFPSGATPEILRQIKKFNCITQKISSQQLASKIIKLIAMNKDSIRAIKKEGILISEKYSIEKTGESLIKAYNKTLQSFFKIKIHN